MSMEDYFEPYGEPEESEEVTCQYCGMEELSWVHTGVGWRLLEGNKLHVCKPSDDGFGVVK